MSFVRVGLALAFAAVMAGCAAVEKFTPYNVASCTPREFNTVHMDIGQTQLRITAVNDEPGQVMVPDAPVVYKLQKSEGVDKYFVSASGKSVLIIRELPGDILAGAQDVDGKPYGILMGVGQPVSTLIQSSEALYDVCQQLRGQRPDAAQ